MEMKRFLTAAAICLCQVLPAQENVYFLPSTTITVEVEAEQETFFAGPYAAFAKKLLNIDVRRADEVTSRVLSATISSKIEADRKSAQTIEGVDIPELMALSSQGLISFGEKPELNASWRFLPKIKGDFTDKSISSESKEVTHIVYKTIPTDTSFVRVPVEQRFTESKTLEDKAREAADMVLSLRQQRMDIASGNTDATFSGAALADALKELRALEEEYLTLFRGYSETRTISASFDVIPQASLKNHRYLAFRTDPERGLVSNGRGTPYYIELEPEALVKESKEADKKKNTKAIQIRYRIPMICRLTLSEDGQPLVETRVPVYQLGREASYPVKTN